MAEDLAGANNTAMYNTAPNGGASQDPMAEASQAIQLRNAMNNITKMKGGAPGTQDALAQSGAGTPYNSNAQ